jgi:hypothetical protein
MSLISHEPHEFLPQWPSFLPEFPLLLTEKQGRKGKNHHIIFVSSSVEP